MSWRRSNSNDDWDVDANVRYLRDNGPSGLSRDEAPVPWVPEAYLTSGLATAAAWTAVTVRVLSLHPDPQIATLGSVSLHNVLTMVQAVAFPLPVLAGVIWTLQSTARRGGWKMLEKGPYRRLNLAYLTVSAWLAVMVRQYPRMAFGYDLIPCGWGKRLSLIHMLSAGIAWGVWKASVGATEIYETPVFRLLRGVLTSFWNLAPSRSTDDAPIDENTNDRAALYATATVGFGILTLLPLVAPYPLATLPSLLGKRLCRPAACFYALATTAAFVLQRASHDQGRLHVFTALRRGLWMGSTAHVTITGLIVAGIDGGGWWLPGPGLARNYPALCQVPVAAALSLLPHVAVMFTGWVGGDESKFDNDETLPTVDAQVL